ncbi:MAG: HEAT repeat domain-containing protein [Desulfovibrio sp.]|uniref:DVU0298 family protein n=1 Tax=Desulfovibrio sp. TaxID=885 RepID=UPI0025C4EC27|nr:DVU0298 family protein [Desulfovibrio sp.]MBS6829492.1 HEAT repeat domain-containing protein [Desulfovibrio sp.]
MPRMRSTKQQLKQYLQSPQWRDHLEEIAAGGASHVGPLFSFLLLGPQTMHRAAVALGLTTARLAGRDSEAARNIIRRFMWHMNEESGNIGWGIPEAFGESLAASPALAKDFHRVLASYLIDLGRDDNYCDNDLLRRSCYWAVGRLAQARPELCAGARPWLRKGLEDNDVICRGMAAWALAQLPPDFMDTPALRRLADAGHEEICELFDGGQLHEKSVSQLAREALAREVPAQAEADADRP